MMKLDSIKGLTSVVVTTLTILFAVSALAASGTPAKFVLEGYDDPARPPISTGAYDEIIARASQPNGRARRDPTAAATNLCIAYIKTSRLREARAACDSAVTAAGNVEGLSSLSWSYWSNYGTLGVARSYSNRAVLNWLTGDRAAALTDLARARRYAPRAHFVLSNVAAFAQRGAALTADAGKGVRPLFRADDAVAAKPDST